MAWVRAAWEEHNEKEYEETVPRNWVNERENKVYWPDRQLSVVSKMITNREKPANDWLCFRLIKIKLKSGKYLYIIIFNSSLCVFFYLFSLFITIVTVTSC